MLLKSGLLIGWLDGRSIWGKKDVDEAIVDAWVLVRTGIAGDPIICLRRGSSWSARDTYHAIPTSARGIGRDPTESNLTAGHVPAVDNLRNRETHSSGTALIDPQERHVCRKGEGCRVHAAIINGK